METICEHIFLNDLLFVPSSCAFASDGVLRRWVELKGASRLVIMQDTAAVDPVLQGMQGVEILPVFEPKPLCFFLMNQRYALLSSALYIPAGSTWEGTHSFIDAQLKAHFIASQMQDFGAHIHENVVFSVMDETDCFSLPMLKGSMHKLPSVICGAGRSLTEQATSLKNLFPHAVIFAGGSAIAAMGGAEIPFHIAAAVDPNPDPGRISLYSHFEAPLFFQRRLSQDVLYAHQGPKIACPSSQASLFEAWMHAKNHLNEEDMDGGWTVATFLTSLAIHLGCDPIVFVGVDLDAEPLYAEGLQEEMHEKKGAKEEWRLSREWIEERIANNPHIRFYNASKGHFVGAENISAHSFMERITSVQKDLVGHIHGSLMRGKDPHANRLWQYGVSVLQQSLYDAQEIVNHLLALFAKYHPHSPLATGEYILCAFELTEEPAYESLLAPAWQQWKGMLTACEASAKSAELQKILFFQKILQNYLKDKDGHGA